MWFKALTGFIEQSPAQVRQLLFLEKDALVSKANDARFNAGTLETLTLAELESQAQALLNADSQSKPIQLQEVVANVQNLHTVASNAGALFQVASQFNLLEMINPDMTPDSGVTKYQDDRTQGPACAMACGAGLIYRNYFVLVNGEVGQTAERQLNMLAVFEQRLLALVNQHTKQSFESLWLMKNGYALPSSAQLDAIHFTLNHLSGEEIEKITASIQIGVHFNTEVTLNNAGHCVTQAYCSAMPISYTGHSLAKWQSLSMLVLNAAYRATLAAGIINRAKTGNKRVYLTLLGGGAFGNAMQWILEAIENACDVYQNSGLHVFIVSYGRAKPELKPLLSKFEMLNKHNELGDVSE